MKQSFRHIHSWTWITKKRLENAWNYGRKEAKFKWKISSKACEGSWVSRYFKIRENTLINSMREEQIMRIRRRFDE